MLVFSDVQSLCISARLWLQVGSPKRLRSDLNQTVSFPPTLFSSSTLRVYIKSIRGLEWKQRTPLCSRVATGISWSSLGGLKGVKPPEAFGERSRDWSLGHTG